MEAKQTVIRHKARIPKNASPEAYKMVQENFQRMVDLLNSPLSPNVNPNNYSRQVVVRSNMRNTEPNGIFRLFTSGAGDYLDGKSLFRLFKR